MSGRGTRVIAGLSAMAGALLVAFLLSVAGVPFAPSTLGQAVIEMLPGWISVPLIELLEFWAQRLLVLAMIATFLACGALAAVLAGERGAASWQVIAVGAAPWIAAPVLGFLVAPDKSDLATGLFASGIGAASFFGALSFLVSAERVASATSLSRRRALSGALAAAGVVALASLVFGGTLRAFRAAAEPVALQIRNLLRREVPVPGDPSFDEIVGLEPRLTESARHYTVDTALVDPRVALDEWKLTVDGHVERPFEIRWDELLDLPAVERPHTLECISNEIGGDLTSTAIWAGVPMADLLARAGPRPGAFDVVLTSVDGYTDSIPLAKAQEADTLLAYLMNGTTLPAEHGYPLRALIPGIYGMKNVKWLTRIEVVTSDFLGYWMERGWSDIATYNTHVRIDAPRGNVLARRELVAVAGIAFAGSRGISRVEVSADEGATWADAVLEPAVGPHTWRRWKWDWTPSGAGRHRLTARATDGEGQVQTPVRRPPFPSGSTGYHTVEVTVS